MRTSDVDGDVTVWVGTVQLEDGDFADAHLMEAAAVDADTSRVSHVNAPRASCTQRVLHNRINNMKKSARGDANTARAGCSSDTARPLSQTHRQDRLQYTATQLASAQCNMHSENANHSCSVRYTAR